MGHGCAAALLAAVKRPPPHPDIVFIATAGALSSFGGLISTSNRVADTAVAVLHSPTGLLVDSVTVAASHPLLWTSDLNHPALLQLLRK